jgi:hypothetical protein
MELAVYQTIGTDSVNRFPGFEINNRGFPNPLSMT